jgi:hypothetical protein
MCPVLDYSAGVWGAKRYFKNEHVHNISVRYFLGEMEGMYGETLK